MSRHPDAVLAGPSLDDLQMNAVDPDLARLGRELRGEALLPDAEGYDGARRVFNGMIDRRPLEDRYDPENLIRLNQNVEPSGRGA